MVSEVISMSQKIRLSITYGLSLMASALAINNTLAGSFIPLMLGSYLIKDLLMKKRHPESLPFALASGIISTLIFVLGFGSFIEVGIPFMINTGILIIFNICYTYALLQANSRQLGRTVFINNICFLSLVILTLLSDVIIKITLDGMAPGVLTGFWLLLVIMGSVNLMTTVSAAFRKTAIRHAALKRKLS